MKNPRLTDKKGQTVDLEGSVSRLMEAKACGSVRDGWTMTAVRLVDVLNAAQHIHVWRDEVLALRKRNEELRNEVDGVLNENNRLRERIEKETVIPERLADLESHSVMLGQISVLVEGWSIAGECATLDCVRLALCDLEEIRAREKRREIRARYAASAAVSP